MTITCDGDVPSVDIPVTLMMFSGSPTDTYATKTELTTGLSGKQNTLTSVTATLTSSGWSNKSQSVTVSGLTSSTVGSVSIATTASATQREAARKAMLAITAQGTNSLTVECDGDVPSVDIPIVVNM